MAQILSDLASSGNQRKVKKINPSNERNGVEIDDLYVYYSVIYRQGTPAAIGIGGSGSGC